MSDKKTALVISAHAADFVWRAGGAIALHQSLGYEVTVACLSYGERGESAKLWKQEDMTLERVKKGDITSGNFEEQLTAGKLNRDCLHDIGDFLIRMKDHLF